MNAYRFHLMWNSRLAHGLASFASEPSFSLDRETPDTRQRGSARMDCRCQRMSPSRSQVRWVTKPMNP